MADFLDSEAEESEEEEELDENEKKKLKKIKAVEESDEDEEEDDEDRLREELKDLIDDNPIEESEGEDSDGSGTSKKRKKSDDEDFDDRLEDEDYDLIEENLGVKVERKRFKRLRRIQDEESEEEQEKEVDEDRDAIANELFEVSGDEREISMEDERRSERSHRPEAETFDEEGSEGEYTDADDFIVDDDGRPIAEKRKKKKPIFSDAALQEAQDIFGVDFDYDEFGKYGEEDYEEEEEEEEEEDEYMDEEDAERPRRPKKQLKKKTTRKSIFEIYEPSELKRGHFTDMDNEIRNTDIPERMQLRSVPVTPVAEGSDELDLEAEWIYKQAFCRPTISIQDAHLNAEAKERARKGPQTIGKIKKALDFMRNQHFEIPFISFYRKEYVLPELNINDLWKVYKFDAKWCQLRQRKENLMKLFEKMRNHQLDEIMKNPDAPLPDNVRVIKDDDIERLKNVQTSEELNDVYHHFMLYYNHEIPAMQESVRQKEKEARREAKLQKRRQQLADAEENGEDPPPEEEPEAEEEEEPDDTLKQAVRTGPYSICRRAGLDGLAKKFGLTPEHFAENLRDNYQRHEVDQEPTEPLSIANEFCSQILTTPEEVMKAAQLMVAIQLAREPLVRKCVREMYMERAKISVRPTKKGIKEIDENHPIYSMKYLKDKPVRDLVGDQFLNLVIAEEDKLITISLSDSIEGNTSSNYVDETKQLYYRDEFSKNVQDWNALRVSSVEMALTRMVIPSLKKELRTNLVAEAKECVMRACCRKMYNWIKVAPYTCEFPEEEDEEWDTSKGLRVMGLAYVPDYSQAAFTCLIAPDGECTDYLRLPHLMKRKNSYREDEKAMKEADLLALKNFLATKKPHVVVIGGESREAMMIAADIKECITALAEEEQFPAIQVEICDNELAKIYSNSNKGVSEFRDYPELLRQAISLARRMQDPLVEFSQLCTADEEILCLKYHGLQDQLPKDELLENLYLEFVNRVNEVGVDVNKAVQQAYCGNLVQFVCGLGPRKGQALIKMLKQTNQRIENRTQLVTACHMGPKVFINCAGFIKIDTNSLGDSTEAYVEVLDGSRVHPETYEWARKMAVDALEYDDEDANPAGALEEILESPERLKDLDLDAFAEELERQGFGNKCVTLYDIRAELNSRYKDLRVPYQSLSAERLFDVLTKETPETFYVGKLILASVVGISHRKPQGDQLDQANPVRNDETGLWQCPFCLKNDFPELSEVWNHFDAGACPGKATGVRLRLDNGISGYIHIKNLSDRHVANPEERVSIGQIIHCRIIKIEVERFSVECTSKSSDLADKNHEWRPQRDPFYDTEAEQKDVKVEEDAKKAKQRQTYVKRVIVHPSFHNISFTEAEKLMQTMKQGEAIVRPSSKGADHLTVTWKVTDEVYQHIDVREEGKENAFSLGQSLWIGNEEFEDLDEIIARHVNPMAAYASELLDFKYYKPTVEGIKDKAEEILKEQKKDNPGGIPYIISAAKNYPGKFLLSYLPRARCRHEYVTVSPEGFRFRGQMFGRVNDLFRWFKEHFRDPVPGQSTPSTPRGAMTSRTPYHTTPGAVSGMNQEAIQRVAQNLPHHMLHSLSQVANQTPHHYPPHTPGTASVAGYGGVHTYPNTPYTPSGQTPFMTPYQTPHHTPHHGQPTPRYGQQTPNHQQGPFVHPPPPSVATPGHHRSTPSHRPTPPMSTPGDPMDWKKAAEAWARLKTGPRMSSTPRYDESRKTPRNYEESVGRTTPRNRTSTRTPSYKSPRGTPHTNSSPRSMSLSGDGTPLYDES
ncbi:transcription elongation factor SPT6 isoform X1 [Nomia melanderi]|uniref:transcription elongation factor SPT6 isoform X1 n=2 Tax=Nomia melanderi TaxID=2448451 RepID=UPI0013047308|nr:transcription elongation factor SPT6 isoform X1 [Nomia melanderi]XP_031835726.1 transcription elongation factor SPT6 isoform X1 [Nomia melanderi]XP_031835727.1 transcription elongation factor SPT6 isoform X1 [Nomia melanderi]